MIYKYSTYIFDLDGTLLDSLTDLHLSCNYALKTCGMPERTYDEVRMFVGNGVKKLMERAVPNGLENPRFEEAYSLFRQYYLQHNLDHTHPYPRSEEHTSELQSRQYLVCRLLLEKKK